MSRKATPEELAMHANARDEESAATVLTEKIIEGNGDAVDTTGAGDIEADTVKPARKRGRPSSAEKALNETLEKETPGAAVGDAPSANKPGRKPGKKAAPSGEALGKQLVGIHALAAMFLQIPEVQISEAEGVQLGSAIVAVCEEYNLSITGKTGAAIQLFAAAAMIYAPRAFVVKARIDSQRTAQEAARNANAQVGNIHAFTPAPN